MTPDTELEQWREQWLANTPPVVPRELKRKVERQSRLMRWMVMLEVLVTVVIGGGYTALAWREPSPEMIVLAAGVWILFAIVWTFAVMNRRGTWNPEQATTAAFIDLSLRRCRRRLSAAWFGVCFYAVEMALILTWIYHHNSRRGPVGVAAFLSSHTAIGVWIFTLLLLAWLVWYRRRRLAELEYLRNLQRQLD